MLLNAKAEISSLPRREISIPLLWTDDHKSIPSVVIDSVGLMTTLTNSHHALVLLASSVSFVSSRQDNFAAAVAPLNGHI